MSIAFEARHHQPRLCLRTSVTIEGRGKDGRWFATETTTINLSPKGAMIYLDRMLSPGAVVDFYAERAGFHARACVRSIVMDAEDGSYVVALEYLDGANNPIVIWPTKAA